MRDLRVDDGLQLKEPPAVPLTPEPPLGGRGTACGKAILLGEHFVVHGAPALAVPIRSRTVTVTLVSPDAPTTSAAPDAPATSAAPVGADAIVSAMIARLGHDPSRVGAEVTASLPMAAGLGSSAALAVALVRAFGERDPERVRARAHDLEHLTHGRPSGIDDAVVSYEVPILFERGAVNRLDVRVPPLWVATVPRTRSTREAVAAVGAWAAAQRARFEAMVAATADLVARALAALGQASAANADPAAGDRIVGGLMDESHALLAEVGVVDARQEALVGRARAAGALGAKVTGAGFGGAILVLAPAEAELDRVLEGAEHVFFAGVSS